MRKLGLIICLMIISGCASVQIPNYIQDKHPYKKVFYGSYDEVLEATTSAIEKLDWEISGKSDPSIYEQSKQLSDPDARQILIFTGIKQTPMILGTRYSRINAYVRTVKENEIEVEVRYLIVNSIPFTSFSGYRKDAFVKRLFNQIEKSL